VLGHNVAETISATFTEDTASRAIGMNKALGYNVADTISATLATRCRQRLQKLGHNVSDIVSSTFTEDTASKPYGQRVRTGECTEFLHRGYCFQDWCCGT